MTMHAEVSKVVGAEAAKSSPAIAVMLSSLMGINWEPIVYMATIVWILLQSAFLVWKWIRDWRGKGNYS